MEPNVFSLLSLINYFLLQTPNVFNKIFLNLSALYITIAVKQMYELSEEAKKGREGEEKGKGEGKGEGKSVRMRMRIRMGG